MRRRQRSARRGGIESVLLRRLPHDSVMHRLGIETKLIGITALTIATGLNTGWRELVAVAAIVVLAVAAARVPWRAVPRLPIWFPASLLLGLGLTALGGGAGQFARLMGFSLLFAALSMVIAWTTELHELAPALRRLAAPLRRVGLPVDEWAITAALSIRCLPLILDECRTVLAGRRQRHIARDPGAMVDAAVDVITASMSAAVRRATDLGEAIAMRGGPAPLRPGRVRLHPRDLVALLLVGAASVVPFVVV
jgi:energy-coupling factor transport system permease protein